MSHSFRVLGLLFALTLITTSVSASPSDRTQTDEKSPEVSSARAAIAPTRTPNSQAALDGIDQPNIVLLLIDDFPAMDERVFARLPNIKATFLEQGIAFTNYWANFSLCCPGRAALLSGQRDDHNGVMENKGVLFDPRETIATELHDVGYYTGIIGKYFNGTSLIPDKSPVGWDYVSIKDDGPYYKYPVWTNDVREYHGTLESDYSVDVMSGKSASFFEQVPADKPIFAWLAPNATHGGADADGVKVPKQPVVAPRFVGDPRCADIPRFRPASYDVLNSGPKPAYVQALPPMADPSGWDLTRPCEALLAVDEWLGNALAALKAQARYDNTIFILASDNGMGWGVHRVTGKIAPYTAQMPLRIAWPAELGSTTREDATLVSNIDIAPTLCEIAGCEMGPYLNAYGVDGQSFAGLIDSSDILSKPARDSIVVEGVGGGVPFFEAIMTGANHRLGQWLFVRYSTGEKELYDVSGGPCNAWAAGEPGDPCMLRNVTRLRPAVRRALAQELTTEWGSSPVTMTNHPSAGSLDGPGSW